MEYTPEIPPNDPALLPDYLAREFVKMQQVLASKRDLLKLQTRNIVPKKYEDGDIVLADGANWNPGGGQGFYGYYNATWNKLG